MNQKIEIINLKKLKIMKSVKSSVNGINYLVNEKENGVLTIMVITSGNQGRTEIKKIVENDFSKYEITERSVNSLSFTATPKATENATEETSGEKVTFEDLKKLYAKNFGLELRKGKNGKYYTVPLKLGKTA